MMENEPLIVPDGYARTKIKPMIRVRHATLSELQTAVAGNQADIIANDGTLRRARLTSVKTWKTRPTEVRIGLKYGMYEYASFDTREALARIVVRVKE